jgi:tricorn protease
MRKFLIWFGAIILFFTLRDFLYSDNFAFPRYPAPSPDGKVIVFSYHGDLWKVPVTGGEASRLTVHSAYDYLPCWSPDGREIAFSSNRYGNDDIFIIPADGGIPVQLTYFSNSDRVLDWTPDGKRIIFSSRRNFYYHRLPVLYQVKRNGGTPFELVPTYADQGKISPDGKYLVFVRGRINWARKHYRGSGNTDIWIYNFLTKEYTQLTTHLGNDYFPLWAPDSKNIYYVTDEDGTFNLWQMDINGKNKKQLTFHKEDGVRFPNISRDGSVIAYEQGDSIWCFFPRTGETKKIKIHGPSDYIINPIERKTLTSQATEMQISPDGKEIAFVVRGEIFVMREKGGKANKLTNNPARDYQICWSPDSKSIVFISDRGGNKDLFIVKSGDSDEERLSECLRKEIIQLTKTHENEHSPKFSPDGESIAFIRGNGDLWIINKDGKNEKRILKGWATPDYSWSPDSKWIAFSRDDNEFNTDVFIISAEGGDPINISQHPDEDVHPVWSKDGRKLAFYSRRIGNTYDIWFVFLRKIDDEKKKEEWEEEAVVETKKNIKEKKVVVKIDFKDIHKRLRRVTSLPGDETDVVISPDGKTFAFRADAKGKGDLWTINWDGTNLKQLTTDGGNPSFITWSKDGKKIYFLRQGGTIQSVQIDGKGIKNINFRAKVIINHPAERLQMFDEAWQILNDRFYDENFHGIDWKEMWRKYRTFASQTMTREDFHDVIRMMIGELNSSHLGIRGPRNPDAVSTGMLGLRFDPLYEGKGLKIKSVIPNGPCDKERSRVKPGEILISIDGYPIEKNTNIHRLLNDKIGEKVEIEILNNRGEKRRLVVEPISFSQFIQKEYDRWVEEKRAMVEKLSKGKLGYIHIQAMNEPSLERFEMELYSVAHGKEGLVIDVRNNGGGWTTDYLLAILSPKPHAITVPRGGEKGYPQDRRPLYAWTKPIIVLCNEYSYSNAEIFSHAIKTLKRGKVVGQPTSGSVISTGGIRLIDGSLFRVPYRGWYVVTTGLNMEGNGCQPDIIVPDYPQDVSQGIDRQLKRAVEELMKEVK